MKVDAYASYDGQFWHQDGAWRRTFHFGPVVYNHGHTIVHAYITEVVE
jgi:hypothetical protein